MPPKENFQFIQGGGSLFFLSKSTMRLVELLSISKELGDESRVESKIVVLDGALGCGIAGSGSGTDHLDGHATTKGTSASGVFAANEADVVLAGDGTSALLTSGDIGNQRLEERKC